MSHAILLQPCFILHTRDYRETSLLVDAFTRDFGKISLVVRGARKPKSKIRSLLQAFCQCYISWTGQGELFTLTHIESLYFYNLQSKILYCGIYVNELLQRLLYKHDPHPELYADYTVLLQQLEQANSIEPNLRVFEKRLLTHLGYGLNLNMDYDAQKPIQANRYYQYHLEQGPAECSVDQSNKISGETLIALAQESLQNTQQLREAKLLMRGVIGYYLGDKPLKSRELLHEI